MATTTINGLTTVTSAAAGDFVPIWRASNADTRKITKQNFIGATFTGGGTIATGGNTLTVGGTSSINGTLTGTVSAAGFTLTVPATGTVDLLGTAQTITALKRFNAGITFDGVNTLSSYLVDTWIPGVDGSTGGPTVTYTTREGKYTRIGSLILYSIRMTINTISGGTGNARFTLPLQVASGAVNDVMGSVLMSNVDVPGTSAGLAFQVSQGTSYGSISVTSDNVALAYVGITNIAAGDVFIISGFYWI